MPRYTVLLACVSPLCQRSPLRARVLTRLSSRLPVPLSSRCSSGLSLLGFTSVLGLSACSSSHPKSPDLPSLSVDTPEAHCDAPVELSRSWRASLVRISDGPGGVIQTDVTALEAGAVVPQLSYPLVIYLHGCRGFWSGTEFRIDWLARNGFAVIERAKALPWVDADKFILMGLSEGSAVSAGWR